MNIETGEKVVVCDMFKDVRLNLPFILMNGVVIFDPVENKNLSVHSIDAEIAKKVLDCYRKYNKSPMLYFMRDSFIEIVYSDLTNPYQAEYVSHRDSLKRKVFRYEKEYHIKNNDNLIYIVTLDKHNEIAGIKNEITNNIGLTSMFYRDNYTDCYFLETFNPAVSKSSGALELKKILGVDRIVAFGDNLNDIPMFEIADEAYAVSNAHEELKKIATGVIDSNDEDAVVDFLTKRHNLI